MIRKSRCCRTYNAAVVDSITHDDITDDVTGVDDDDDDDDGCYQLPLPVEQIHWVDGIDTFHSSVSHIAQVYNAWLTMSCYVDVYVIVMQSNICYESNSLLLSDAST